MRQKAKPTSVRKRTVGQGNVPHDDTHNGGTTYQRQKEERENVRWTIPLNETTRIQREGYDEKEKESVKEGDTLCQGKEGQDI